MKGDFTRDTFDPKKHYSSVLQQQGRVQLDADWNEQQSITRHRIETEARDIIGPHGGPRDNAGFKILFEFDSDDNPLMRIEKGTYYVDGILCENDETIDYDLQPDLPKFPTLAERFASIDPDPRSEDSFISWFIYLDVWHRHVSYLDDDQHIREVALGGPDTATRIKTVWQVRIFPLRKSSDEHSCDPPPSRWSREHAASNGLLRARLDPSGARDDPCVRSPTAG
jgi:Family of unknown function (DUF6519)